MSIPDLLDNRALNRATLERQLLLRRAPMSAGDALQHLVGVQAQAPDAAYVGLWSRLVDFHHDELVELVTERGAVRIPLMRATIHLVTAADCLDLRPQVQSVLARSFANQSFAKQLQGLELEKVLNAASELLDERPLTRSYDRF